MFLRNEVASLTIERRLDGMGRVVEVLLDGRDPTILGGWFFGLWLMGLWVVVFERRDQGLDQGLDLEGCRVRVRRVEW